MQINHVLGVEWKPSTSEDTNEANEEGEDGLAYEVAARREMDRVRAEDGTPYFIPSGESTDGAAWDLRDGRTRSTNRRKSWV